MKFKSMIVPVAFATVLSTSACDEWLTETPYSDLTEETFFSSRADALAALSAVYRGFGIEPANGRLTGWMASLALESSGDLANAHRLDQNNLAQCPGTLTCDATIEPLVGPWPDLYRVIYRANLVMDRVPETPGVSDADKALFVAEAKFLRGWSYSELEKRYGDVPIYTSTAGQEDKARKPHAEVHALIIKDLTEAEAVLPATRPAAEWGRVTKGAAQALLADRYLWNASRWNTGAAEYQKAAEWADKVITSGRYSLLNDYITAFLPNNKGNAEVIWTRTSSGLDNRSSLSLQAAFFPRELTGSSGNATTDPTDWAYQGVYEAGDYRKEVNFRVSGCNAAGTTCFPNGFPEGPHPYKFRPTNPTNGIPNDVEWVFFRLADMYLTRAEARNELGDQAGALADLNLLRARARRGTGSENRAVPANLSGGFSKEALREIVFQDRTRELIWENKRWYDLVRRDTQDPGYWANELRAHDPEARRRNDPATQKFRKLWPVPQRELDLLPGVLCQNKGYGGAVCEIDIEISK